MPSQHRRWYDVEIEIQGLLDIKAKSSCQQPFGTDGKCRSIFPSYISISYGMIAGKQNGLDLPRRTTIFGTKTQVMHPYEDF